MIVVVVVVTFQQHSSPSFHSFLEHELVSNRVARGRRNVVGNFYGFIKNLDARESSDMVLQFFPIISGGYGPGVSLYLLHEDTGHPYLINLSLIHI